MGNGTKVLMLELKIL